MIDFITHNMAPLMFAGLIIFMLYGYPAFSLAAVGLLFGFAGIELGLIQPDFLGNIVFQLESITRNDLLLAIPFFTLMGAIWNAAVWLKICSKASASCLAGCVAACPMRSFWWEPCWAR